MGTRSRIGNTNPKVINNKYIQSIKLQFLLFLFLRKAWETRSIDLNLDLRNYEGWAKEQQDLRITRINFSSTCSTFSFTSPNFR